MKVAIFMGSVSDLEVLKPAIDTLHSFSVPCEVHVLSAHRTPEAVADFARNARDNGFGVIIAAAGKAAHLAGVIAAHTTIPVIGIPIKSSTLDGLDALLSTVQMPAGIPVATVAIDGSQNAALLAVEILSLADSSLKKALDNFREEMTTKILETDRQVNADYSYT